MFKKKTRLWYRYVDLRIHKSMKQVSHSGKYSLSASRAHHSHLQFPFVAGDAFSKLELSQRIQRRKEIKKKIFSLLNDDDIHNN